jgi:hypothetical protein
MALTIELQPIIQRLAKDIASQRGPDPGEISSSGYESYEGIPGKKRHILGALGEMAFAEHYDLQLDTSPGTDDDYDFVVRFRSERSTIEVKSTTYPDGALQVPVDRVRADYYVLTFVEDTDATSIDLIGMCSKSDLKRADTVEGPHSNQSLYSMPTDQLDPLPDQSEISRWSNR